MDNLDLNVFRLKDESDIDEIVFKLEQECKNKYAHRYFEKIIKVEEKDYYLKFFFYLNENSRAKIDWYTELSNLFDSGETMNKKVYSGYGILLIYCDEFKYAISFGRAMYLLNKYINWDFGLEMAAKMLDKSSINVQSSKYYSTSKNKSLIVYNKGRFNAEAGESVDLINANIREIEGKSLIKKLCEFINTKVGFSSGIKIVISMENILINDILNVIVLINRIYINYNNRFNIPKLLFLKLDDEIVKELNNKINSAILEEKNIDVSVSVYSVIDSELMLLNNIKKYKLSYNRKYKEYNSVTIDNIRDFMIENNIKNISDINLKIYFEESSKTINVLKIIDYTTEIEGTTDYFCLYDGRWARFNNNYIDTVQKKIEEINNETVLFDKSFDLSYKELESIKQSDKKEICDKLNIPVDKAIDSDMYREYVYNYKICKEKGGLLLDRKEYNNIEICDIYYNGELVHTKIGSPGNFNECINQSMYGFEIWNSNKERIRKKLYIDDVNTVTLLLITNNKSVIRKENINEFKSFRFKLNLIDWKTQVESYGKNAKIIVAEIKE